MSLHPGSNKACCECLTLIIEKLVEGGPEFSQYEDDHHMDLMAKQFSREDRQISKNRGPGTSDRYTHDDERDRDRDRDRDRENRKVIMSDSTCASPSKPNGSLNRNISLNMSSLRDSQFGRAGSSSRDSGDAWEEKLKIEREMSDTRRTKERARDWQREQEKFDKDRIIYGESLGKNGSMGLYERLDDMSIHDRDSHSPSGFNMPTYDRDRDRDRDCKDRDNKESRKSSPYTSHNSSFTSTPYPSSRPPSHPNSRLSSRSNSLSNTPREQFNSAPGVTYSTSRSYKIPAENSRDRIQVILDTGQMEILFYALV